MTRLDETSYLIVTAGASQTRDFSWLRRHIPPDAFATLTDMTSGYAMLGVMGPRSRELLSGLTDADLSNEAFPFATSREIDLAMARVRATRMTYVGELGWELYVPTEFALHVYDALVEAGESVGLRHAGYHAMHSLRIEKAYRSWGHDISDEDTPLEAGLGFAVAWGKEGGFIGREALLRLRERGAPGLTRRLVQFALEDPEPLLYHNEPIWRDGVLVGRISSGMYGHTLGRAIGLGYVANDGPEGVTPEWIIAGSYELEVAAERFPARVSLRPMYDPTAARVRE